MNLLVNRLLKVGISLTALMLNVLPMPAGAHQIEDTHGHGGCKCSFTFDTAVGWKKLLGIEVLITNKCELYDSTVLYPGETPSCICNEKKSKCVVA